MTRIMQFHFAVTIGFTPTLQANKQKDRYRLQNDEIYYIFIIRGVAAGPAMRGRTKRVGGSIIDFKLYFILVIHVKTKKITFWSSRHDAFFSVRYNFVHHIVNL